MFLDLTFINHSAQPLTDFAIQFNVNSYGLLPSTLSVQVGPNETKQVSLQLFTNGQKQEMNPVNLLQIAIKNHLGVYYFQTLVPMDLI